MNLKTDAEISKKLKLCPLCGNMPRYIRGLAVQMIKCDNCRLNIFRDYETEQSKLVRLWNERRQ